MIRSALLLGLLLASAAAVAADAVSTVGSVTENNGLSKNGWLLVRTPSILRVTGSEQVTPDLRQALEQYDRIQELGDIDPAIRAEALRRSADLRIQLAESGEMDPVELGKAVTAYRRLLSEQPDYVRADRVLYQLARASEMRGDEAQAIASLKQLGQRYPQSIRRADAQFRAAELLYRDRRYAEAESQYREVVALGSKTPLFEPAQYKYAWSLLQQSRHEQALPVFIDVLERELPPGELSDPKAALAAVRSGRAELAGDALRGIGISLTALGGGAALNRQFARSGEPRFAALLHAALGEQLLEKRRYTDAAGSYLAFIERHPRHALAPGFQRQAIAAYERGGFTEQLVAAKETYVREYAPGSAYWAAAAAPAEVQAQVRQDIEELGRYYQAGAQRAAPGPLRQAQFLKAADWYGRWLSLYPQDTQAPAIHLTMADALLDGGRADEAARQYARVAYDYPVHARSAEAAYAAVQAWQQAAAMPAARSGALRESVTASLKLAERHPQHPQRFTVLARAAGDLYELGNHAQAVAQAQRVLDGSAQLPPDLARSVLGIVADARYAQKQYAEAETAYAALLQRVPAGDAARQATVEQLAASIYRQGEAARGAGDLRAAAAAFQRVGRAAPEAGIRATADYDAAAALIALQDWPQAQAALETFRQRYPQQPLLPEVDRKLAVAYQKGGRPAQAADAYARIAARAEEAPALRRDAAWLAAELYGEARMPPASQRAYEDYLSRYPQPLEQAQQARRRLADLARDDAARYQRWLGELVDADARGGSARTAQTRLLAAQASLELGRVEAAKARALALRSPVEKTLPARKAATERAIAGLNRAAGYGF
ncbi:MAG TPA: tetratricopeptide repeat protein, partial [Solimonas sp.]